MGVEIERKFLLRGEDWRIDIGHSVRMAQGYLNHPEAKESGQQRCSVRVRIVGQQACLNLKSREPGRMRQEFDYPIPVSDAQQMLLALCAGGLIDKTRHYVRHAGHTWEIDEFAGANAGLLVAEIELATLDEDFERPAWLGAEVTELRRFYNFELAGRPYAHWSDEEKFVDVEASECS